MKRIRDAGSPLLLFSTGDQLFLKETAPSHLQQVWAKKAETMMQGLEQIGYDATTIGERDLAVSPDFLIQQVQRGGVPFLVANLEIPTQVVVASHQVVVASHKVFHIDGLKVGVFGLMGQKIALPEGWTVGNPVATAETMTASLRETCDLVIALTHQGLDDDLRLAQSVDGLDVILGGHDGAQLLQPLKVNGTLIAHASDRGKYVGRLDLTLSAGGEPSPHLSYRHVLVPMLSDIEDDPAIAKLIDSYRSAVRTIESHRAPEPDPPSQLIYAGTETCRCCHGSQYALWAKTAHAHAHDTLVAKEQALNPECIGCHSTGYRQGGGYWQPRMVAARRDLRHVQCEVCHGPGGQHIQTPEVVEMRIPDETLCTQCHTLANDPDFNFRAALLHIRCPSSVARDQGSEVGG